MTVSDFVNRIEAVYYEYNNKILKDEVVKYLASFKGDQLAEMYAGIRLDFSRKYKTSPDIADFEAVVQKYKIGAKNPYPEVKEIPFDEKFKDELPEDWNKILKNLVDKSKVK